MGIDSFVRVASGFRLVDIALRTFQIRFLLERVYCSILSVVFLPVESLRSALLHRVIPRHIHFAL